MTSKGFFIAGTDTDVGKTWVSISLMHKLQSNGLVVLGMKPVAAGCEWLQGGWKNQDALLLQKHATQYMDYELVNPYAFERPVSPHIACGEEQVSMDVILSAYQALQSTDGFVVVEGAGGWFSPLSRELNNAELAEALHLPVIMVVGMRLGCINHALLTYRAIKASGVDCAGWVAVQIDPDMQEMQASLDYLQTRIEVQLFGLLPYQETPDFEFLSTCLGF
jgi:dethiobiotin synthetase